MSKPISDSLLAYLTKWHATTVERKLADGNQVDLPFNDFLSLFEKRQLNSLQKAINEGRLQGLQDRDNDLAYVATWVSYAACSSGIYDKTTACICSRRKSLAINLPKPGDTLRPGHRRNISKGLTGVPKSDDHRANISEAKKGVKIGGWTDERRAKRKADLAAKKAALKRVGW